MDTQSRRRGTLSSVALVALLMASCGTGESPSPSASSPAAESSPSAIPPTPTPVPSPVGIEPVTPTSTTLVMRLALGSDIGAPVLAMALYDDGSLVDLRSGPPTVLRLSASGLATVIDRFHASGLFSKSHVIPAPPVPHGFMILDLTFVDGGSSVTVHGTNVGDDPETRALIVLTDGLSDPVAWLPETAFVDGDRRAHPYLATSARVTSETVELAASDWTNTAQTIDKVAWPLSVPPAELGEPMPLPGSQDRTLRCGVISGAEAGAIRAALAAFESETLDPDPRTTRWYVWLPGPLLLKLTLRWNLPDEAAGCIATDVPDRPSLAAAPRPSLRELLEAGAHGLTPRDTGPALIVQAMRTADGATLAHVSYYADGTVLVYDPPSPAVGIGAMRLNAVGVADLQGRLEASDLLTAEYSESVPDNAPPYTVFSLVRTGQILNGHELIVNGSDRGHDPKATAIAALAQHLLAPAGWLPAEDWYFDPSAIRPFRPGLISVAISHEDAPLDPALPLLPALRWPLSGSIDSFGTLDEDANEAVPGSNPRTAEVSSGDALALLRALDAAGAECWGAVTNAECQLAEASRDGVRIFRLSIVSDFGWGP